MTFLLILACSIAACFLLRKPIHKYPVLFYALAVAVDLAFIAGSFFEMPRDVWVFFFVLIQKCTLSLALFVIVMYVGVFSKDSEASHALRPIRAEISIVAWLLSLGHMAVYLESYVPRILAGGSFGSNMMASFAVAVILFVLLMVLGITSFNFVKKRMRRETWAKIQKLAYPFFLLTYIHLMIILAPSALRGGEAAVITVVVYSLVFVAYTALRIRRAVRDREEAALSERKTVR